jgi:hypothetical protein
MMPTQTRQQLGASQVSLEKAKAMRRSRSSHVSPIATPQGMPATDTTALITQTLSFLSFRVKDEIKASPAPCTLNTGNPCLLCAAKAVLHKSQCFNPAAHLGIPPSGSPSGGCGACCGAMLLPGSVKQPPSCPTA